MVKGNPKSSATSGTRKKHLKKHAPAEEPPPKERRSKKGERGQKNAPKVKIYIPPVKPAPVQPDPLETTGLAHTLPADLLVILRNISKKAQVTKIRALEELQAGWVNQCLKEGRESLLVYTLVEMLPVWLHHISALFVNSSRRVRLLAASLHSALLLIPPVREQVVFFLRETASTSQVENILGTWCLAAHDVDRLVSTAASKSWSEIIITKEPASTSHLFLTETLFSSLDAFIQRAALDPSGVYVYLNPVPPPPPPPLAASSRKSGMKGSAIPTPRKDDGDQTPRSKADEQEENEQDRKARLRIGALGAARWVLGSISSLSEGLQSFYANPVLWSVLQPAEVCPWVEVESFGFAQPNVRKAGWSLLQSLMTSHKAQLETVVPTIGTAVLRSAWVEMDAIVQSVMWQPLLIFLKQFPQSWTLDENRTDIEEDGSGSEPDSDVERNIKEPHPTSSAKQPSKPYQEFLQFLQLGCAGSPTQGFPIVVIVISTIPSSILMPPPSDPSSQPLSQFFSSFWAAIDTRALTSLHRIAASAAFLSSLLECIVFLIKRLRNDGARVDEGSVGSDTSSPAGNIAETILREQFSLIWERLSSKKLKVAERAAARLLAQTLESLLAIDRALYDVSWDALVTSINSSTLKEDNAHLVSAALKVFYDRFKEGTPLKERADVLLKAILMAYLERREQVLVTRQEGETASFALLIGLLDQFREGLFFDDRISTKLDTLLSQNAYRLLQLSPPLLLSYLLHRKNEPKSLKVWHSLLSSIASRADGGDRILDQKSITSLLAAAQKGQLPKYLNPHADELDGLIGGMLDKALAGPLGSDEASLVRQILNASDYFISKSAFNTFLQVIIATFTANATNVIEGQDVQHAVFDVSIDLTMAVFPDLLREPVLIKSILPDVFIYAYLFPNIGAEEGEIETSVSQVVAKGLWQEWLQMGSDEDKELVAGLVKGKLSVMIGSTTVRPVPEDILQMLAQKHPGLNANLLRDILPSAAQLDATLDTLSPAVIDPSIGIFDALIPPGPSSKFKASSSSTDRRGFSNYARTVDALLHALSEDRHLARRNLWALRHFFALSIYAQDLLRVPLASSRSPVFDNKVTPAALANIVAKTKQISVYLLTSAVKGGDSWRRGVVDRLVNGKDARGLNELQTYLFDVVNFSRKDDCTRDTRVLKMVLEPLLTDDMDVVEGDLWVQLARKLERFAPQTSMTIISVITATGAEPPKLVRYRNELAAALLGVKPHKANTEGLLILRKLAACAPDSKGTVEFLPTPRAVNVVKACQGWVLSEDDDDEEVDEEVESAMLPIFMHLAPILQNVPGAHWAFFFDVLEAVLERASPEDEGDEGVTDEGSGFVALARALRLVTVLEELTKMNKGLMAEWQERRMRVLTTIRDLNVLVNLSAEISSAPRSACRELVLEIVQHLPASLIDHDTLPKMSHLIEDPSTTVQKMAYQLLKAAAQKRTEYFVIEAGVDTEAVVHATLPPELLEIIQRDLHFTYGSPDGDDEGEEQSQNLFGYLLGWMLIFDLFQDASFKVKSSYIEQLRNVGVVVDHFIPCLLGLLRLNQGGLLKAFKLNIWAVDRFFVDLYESGNPHTIPVLAAHVYYRALLTIPSLIHTWVLDCKDRQLTNTVTNYTSTYFSPVLIRAELEHVRSHAANDGLADDNLSVKVAGALNEVAAAYSVDDHQLEIKLRIPNDWPLHKIEVRDVKRVGVDENRWRAWVLGVQQTIWAHNGRIVDGLGLFKKNVTLHFEGQVECAICYSIISVMDGSLPKKPCKTCKNRFHSGCLYKWFNSSHSSSCPLCRSDII